MKVSVIVPVYNSLPYLTECLQSLVDQTLKDIEIICVDDGSTDSSRDEVNRFCQMYKHVKLIAQQNQGVSVARNEGFNVAAADYVYFMDSDDVLEKNALDILYKAAVKSNLDVLAFDGGICGDQSVGIYQDYINYYKKKKSHGSVKTGKKLFMSMWDNGDYNPCVYLYLIKRKYLVEKEIASEKGIIHQDELFTFNCLVNAERAGHWHQQLYLRRIRNDSITTGSNNLKHFEGYFRCFTRILAYALKADADQDFQNSIYRVLTAIKDSANKYFFRLTEEQLQALVQLPGVDRLIFEAFFVGVGIDKTADAELKKIIMSDLENSLSYKIGRIVTFIPRRLFFLLHKH